MEPFSFLILVLLSFPQSLTSIPLYKSMSCYNGRYTANSTYQSNLNVLAMSLPKEAVLRPNIGHGFSIKTVGSFPDQVFGLSLCRGDIDDNSCYTCLTTAFQEALKGCGFFLSEKTGCPARLCKATEIFYDFCFVGFSNETFLSNIDDHDGGFGSWEQGNLTMEVDRFRFLVDTLFNTTVEYAAHNTSKFATGEVDLGDQELPKLYMLVQCMPYLTTAQCQKCLGDSMADMLAWDRFVDPTFARWGMIINGTILTRVRRSGMRCDFRYGVSPFYFGDAMVKLNSDLLVKEKKEVPLQLLQEAGQEILTTKKSLLPLGLLADEEKPTEKLTIGVDAPTVTLEQNQDWMQESTVAS